MEAFELGGQLGDLTLPWGAKGFEAGGVASHEATVPIDRVSLEIDPTNGVHRALKR